MRKGESECQYYINKLEYLDEKQRDPVIDSCKTLLCHGELRNKSGSVSNFLYYTQPHAGYSVTPQFANSTLEIVHLEK